MKHSFCILIAVFAFFVSTSQAAVIVSLGTYDLVVCGTRGPNKGDGTLGTITFLSGGKINCTTKNLSNNTSIAWTGTYSSASGKFQLKASGQSNINGTFSYASLKALRATCTQGTTTWVAAMTRQ